MLGPTVPVARHLFAAPTFHYYKTGVVLLAWLSGHQDHFVMLGGHHGSRPVPHLVKAFLLADAVGLFPDPELAAERIRLLLRTAGFDD